MGRIPESTIQDIRSRVDIVGLIGRYVDLKRAGRSFKGLCPFHAEKTPSFNVSPDRQIFHCFGCSEGGDVIGFLVKHDGLSFPEAIRTLAAECGVEIEESSRGSSGERGLVERLYAANQVAQRVYCEALAASQGLAARDYLKARGVGDDAVDRFGIGLAPDRWDAVVRALESSGIPAEIGERAGLLAPRRESDRGYYDRLRGRITFPIHDVRGRVVGFGGRALQDGQEPKYLNTPETPIFRKRETFYGFPDALGELRSARQAIVCEGYFDRIALARVGLGEALATCGTALTREHAVQLCRRTAQVVLLFDGDEAGNRAVERSLEVLLPAGLRVKVAALPGGEDPDSFLARRGEGELRALVDSARDAIDFVIRQAVDAGCATPAQKADVVNRVVPLVALIPDPVERVEHARGLANWAATDEPAVQAAVRIAVQRGTAPPIEPRSAPRRAASEERHLHELAVLLFRKPALAGRFPRETFESLLPGGSWKAVVGALLDAAESGWTDRSGCVDLFAVEERLDEDARARLREVAVEDELFRSAAAEPELAIDALVGRLDKRRIAARQRELTRKMADPEADHDAILREKNQLRLEGLAG